MEDLEAGGRGGPDAPSSTPTSDGVDNALRCAEAGNVIGMLEHLHASGFLEGLTRLLRKRWRHLDEDECNTIAGRAADVFFAKASGGEQIREPKAFLYKVSMNMANSETEHKLNHAEFNEEFHRRCDGPSSTLDRDQLRVRALEIARGLLPQLGQENVRQVMAFYLDAVEKRVEHVSTAEVVEALGLSPATVRQCKSRGFHRLRRVARAKGITLDESFPKSEETEDDSEENDDEHE